MAGRRQGTAVVGRLACHASHAKWSRLGRAIYLVSLPVLVRGSRDQDSNSLIILSNTGESADFEAES